MSLSIIQYLCYVIFMFLIIFLVWSSIILFRALMIEIRLKWFVLTEAKFKIKDVNVLIFKKKFWISHDINFLTTFKNTLTFSCYQRIALELFDKLFPHVQSYVFFFFCIPCERWKRNMYNPTLRVYLIDFQSWVYIRSGIYYTLFNVRPFQGNDSISTAFFAMSNAKKTTHQGKHILYTTFTIYHRYINNKVNFIFEYSK